MDFDESQAGEAEASSDDDASSIKVAKSARRMAILAVFLGPIAAVLVGALGLWSSGEDRELRKDFHDAEQRWKKGQDDLAAAQEKLAKVQGELVKVQTRRERLHLLEQKRVMLAASNSMIRDLEALKNEPGADLKKLQYAINYLNGWAVNVREMSAPGVPLGDSAEPQLMFFVMPHYSLEFVKKVRGILDLDPHDPVRTRLLREMAGL